MQQNYSKFNTSHLENVLSYNVQWPEATLCRGCNPLSSLPGLACYRSWNRGKNPVIQRSHFMT